MKVLKYYEGGHCLSIQGVGEISAHPGIRGKVSRFSAKARKRLLFKVNTINRHSIVGSPVFITLTYPPGHGTDAHVCKRHLDNFGKTFIRRYPLCSLIWKMEYTKALRIHYHLIVFNTDRSGDLKLKSDLIPFVSNAWFRICGTGNKKHLSAGTRCEYVKSWNGVIYYTSKYLAKTGSTIPLEFTETFSGRFWGIINRKCVPIMEREFVLDEDEYFILRRRLKKFLEKSTRYKVFIYNSSHGFTVFIDYMWAIRHIVNMKEKPLLVTT